MDTRMQFSRSNPSPRYRALQVMYAQLHERGDPHLGLAAEHTFSGMSLMSQLGRVKALVERTGATTLLDYGSGKATQYGPQTIQAPDGTVYECVADYWDVAVVHCYDPCYPPYSTLPQGRFDAVVSTDVLEHCPEEDVPWIIGEIFDYAQLFVYANVACYPAKKQLPNGENAHCTIKPLAWWEEIFHSAASARPGLLWEVWIQSAVPTAAGTSLLEQRIGSR
jgi:hypothetical protein